jgi:hypothetical protein
MKNLLLTLLIVVLHTFIAFSQSVPQGMRYQAVARDEAGKTIDNETIALQISLRAGEKGDILYTERHEVTTNQLGLFSITVGEGKAIKGEFGSIPWSLANIWLEIDMSEAGGKIFTNINSSQLLTVPYAFHAGTADNYSGMDDPTQKNSLQFYWSTTGNLMTIPGTHYVGTRDYKDVIFKTNDLHRMAITKDGDIDINGNLDVGINLNVGNNIFIGNDLRAERDGSFGRDLLVQRNTEIDGTLGVDGITTLRNPAESLTKDNGSLIVEGGVGIEKNVNIGGNTEIDGTLGVDGVTTLKNTTESTTKDNGSLVVEGGVGIEKNVNIGGNSGVTGNSTVGGTFGVNGIARFNNTTESTNKDNGSVIIEGGVGIEKNINVGGNSNVTGNSIVGGNSTVSGNSTVTGITGLNGQVTITANVNGGDASYGAYPLRVQGADQGIAIKVNSTNPLGVNNFVTFINGNGTTVGGIEGQDYAEKQAFPPFAVERAINIATEVKCAAGIAISLIPTCVVGLIGSCGVSGSSIGLAAADLVLASANLAAYEVFLSMFIGVTYSSGSADYAEWLQRAYPEEQIAAGDIVAVNGGKITKYTDNAQQYMAISTNPAVLGNVPTDGNVSGMEKVAFMGQIPVKVRGIVLSGDYILPSGLHDGTGIAISPNKITAEQYREIVGVAWSTSIRENGVSYINMAIGLNSNDVAALVVKQEKKMNEMERRLTALEKGTEYTPGKEVEEAQANIPAAVSEKEMSREEILASQWPSELSDEVMKDAIFYLESEYNRRGFDIASHPGLQRLFTDMDFQADVIKRAKETYKSTYQNIQLRASR